MRDATLKNIASRVGVSISTVSRVLSGKASQYRISKATEQAVLFAANELNYRPNQLARGLRMRRTRTLGLVIPDISNSFFSSIARSIEIQARKDKYSIILCDSQENLEFEIASIRLLQSHKVDGFIICPVGKEREYLEQLVSNFNIPLVIIDRSFPGMNCSTVTAENYKGSMAAVSYLMENGHTTIGCIQGLIGNLVNKHRIQGYIDVHKKFDIPFESNLIVGDSFSEEGGYQHARALLALPDRPTAIYACSNQIALGTIRAIHEAGLNIPDDISLMAIDDEIYFKYMSTPITAVSQPREEMGIKAFELLVDQVEGGTNHPQYITFPTNIIVRQSVKRLKNAIPAAL